MSGGHFDYLQSRMRQEADELHRLIETNPDGGGYDPGIIRRFKEAEKTLRQAAAMLNCIDKLVCGDYGEATFKERWSEEIES